jgi:hypothetical protein
MRLYTEQQSARLIEVAELLPPGKRSFFTRSVSNLINDMPQCCFSDVDFYRAVRFAAAQYGVSLPADDKAVRPKRRRAAI